MSEQKELIVFFKIRENEQTRFQNISKNLTNYISMKNFCVLVYLIFLFIFLLLVYLLIRVSINLQAW
jgi:hypothetical protein